MTHRSYRLTTALLAIVILASVHSTVQAQGGGASSLSGTVVDASGGVIPGADITVKNDATGTTFTAVSGSDGTFNIPAIAAGTYTVTVSLMGFKTALLKDVKVNVAVPAAVRATLEVGSLEESVVVSAAGEIVQTQSSTISTTLDVNQVNNLPLVSRDAMNFLVFLPGVETATTNRASSVNGLPQGAINITIDGINSQDNYLKNTDGFFSIISPRLDAVEEVTVSTSAQGAESAGQGAVQIRFVTRQGTNRMQGSVYYSFRSPALNSNYWFNNRDLPPDPATGKAPRDQVKLYQPGFRVGGPIVRDRAFYFFNYEEFRLPIQITRTRTILNPRAEQGFFRYNVTSGGQTQVREVNLLALAAANGQTATMDPTIGRLLGDIRQSTTTTGGVIDLTDPELQQYTFTNSGRGHRYYPTARLDYNITSKHRFTYTGSYQYEISNPDTLNSRDPNFPGFPGAGTQRSMHYTWSGALRSTIASNVVNEARLGYQTTLVYFFPELTPDQYGGTAVADQKGYLLGISAAGITNATGNPTPSARAAPATHVEDTLNWIKGRHSVNLGGSLTQINLWMTSQTTVPTINFGIVPGDPANGMFTTANFAGASATNLTAAQNLYAVLTGRVSTVSANARLAANGTDYVYLGQGVQEGRMREFGFWAQDAWRLRKNLTLNYGMRYEVQLPFTPLNSIYSTATTADVWGVSGVGNLFKPGVLTGQKPQYQQYQSGVRAYNIDWNNVAPSVGFAWTPAADSGWRRQLLGQDGDTVIRGGYSRVYLRQGMASFSGVFSNNPGSTITISQNQALGNLGALPFLFRDTGRLAPPPFPASPNYPLTGLVTDSVSIFDPNLQVPNVHSWSVGIQRALNKTTAVEERYVGNHSLQPWTAFNFNEANIVENGFLNEFKQAQANLQANIASGRGNSFAYFGPNTGTAPLPIFLAYFAGVPGSQAGDPTKYAPAAGSFTNSTFLNFLAANNPQPYSFATSGTNGLYSDATRRANAIAAGLPSNFFVVNPDLTNASITGNGGYTRYDALQVEVRRRMSKGFLVQGSYTAARDLTWARYSLRTPWTKETNTNGVDQALKGNWVYELPFGNGRRFGASAGRVRNLIIGDWGIDGTGRVQSGRILSFGNVRMVGFTQKDLEQMFTLRFAASGLVYMLPQDVIDNTIKAFSVSATSPTGYGSLGVPTGRYFAPANGPDCIQVVTGDCAPTNIYVRGPAFVRFDLSAVKRIAITQGVRFEGRIEFLNVLNNVNFTPVAGASSNATLGQVTAAYRDAGAFNTLDPGGRLIQIVTRVTW